MDDSALIEFRRRHGLKPESEPPFWSLLLSWLVFLGFILLGFLIWG